MNCETKGGKKMKTYTKFSWLLFLLVSIAQASGESMKASGLLNVCIAVAHPNVQIPEMEAVHRPLCTGYMNGWLGGIEGVLIPDDKGFLQTVTLEDGVTGLQMAKVFVLYMENHPEEENKPAHVALMHALTNAGLVSLESPGKEKSK
jgi:hypothetical protein